MYGLEGLALHRRRRAKNGSRLHDAVLFSVLVMAASMLSCSFFDRSRQTKSETRKIPCNLSGMGLTAWPTSPSPHSDVRFEITRRLFVFKTSPHPQPS